MEKIRIKVVDFFEGGSEWFADMMIRALEPLGEAVVSDEPDFLLCSCFGKEALRYDCTRILWLGENLRPDFNLYDYAIGTDWMEYEDRFCHLPWYCLPNQEKIVAAALEKHRQPDEFYRDRKFCNYVVSNFGANPLREEVFYALSEYKHVDSGGRSHNNLPDGQPVRDKLEFQKGYRFSLAFENAQTTGYCTEKILDAFASGGVPIYWGDPAVTRIYNPAAFINCNDYLTVHGMIERIRTVDENPELWRNMVRQPAFVDEALVRRQLKEDILWSFVRRVVAQGPKKSRRRSPDHWTGQYEHEARQTARLQRQFWWPGYSKLERNLVKRGWIKR